jgi:NADH-quinone oxidoreductase subunit M
MQRSIAGLVSIINLVLAIVVRASLAPTAGYQMVEQQTWLPTMGLHYAVGVDGISVWLVVLAALMTPLAIFAARQQTEGNQRAFYALLLVLASSLIGAFVATDLLLFYVFFELTLIPTALLIALYGVGERQAAATKFFVYPFVGSVFLLVSIAGLVYVNWQQTGVMTFDSVALSAAIANGTLKIDENLERLLFAGFFIAFAIKTPICGHSTPGCPSPSRHPRQRISGYRRDFGENRCLWLHPALRFRSSRMLRHGLPQQWQFWPSSASSIVASLPLGNVT